MDQACWRVVVLAAGQGTRMKSDLPKVLHRACGRTLIDRVLDRADSVADPGRIVVVVGHGADRVRDAIRTRRVRTTVQEPQLGTGDALRVGLEADDDAADAVLVLSGDVPLLRDESMRALMQAVEDGAAGAVLTAEPEDPASYGRVVRGVDDQLERIVEMRDADAATRGLAEVNAGVYAFRTEPLRRALAGLTTDNVQGEYYLTDVVADLRRRELVVAAVRLADPDEMQGVNTRADLARVASALNRRLVERLMRDGVTVVDPDAAWIDDGCHVERDAVLEPGVVVRGGAWIGKGATIGAHSVIDGARIAPGETVPPLSHRT